MDATDAEVQGATGALAGTVDISGYRAMPPCTVQGTPKIQILDASGNVLPVTQVGASNPDEIPGPVTLGGTSDMPGFDLEMRGVPTSAPAFDPNNHNFVYLRFQRGVMHYDASCSCTQGILLADYLKSILTGQNLSADLDQQARSSPLYKQYDPNVFGWVHNPALLPDTILTDAFEQA